MRQTTGARWYEEPEILVVEKRMRTLEMIRDHIWEGHTYFLGRKDLEFAELLPRPADGECEVAGSIEPFRPRALD
jgi:hypothetical protein